ncbi:MAG: hypothetical protein K6F26_09595 [Lachnospiraceae bacterium]|nr:hypothetical protein [Lachnospiraceae bacterium]
MKLTRKLLSICLSLCIFFTCMVGIKVPTAAAAETTPASTTDDPVIIVSLGDSYSSGEGIEEFYGQKNANGTDRTAAEKVANPDWLAHRSTKAWSGLLTSNGFSGKAAQHRNENWYFAAASGAKIEHLTNLQTKSYDYGGEKDSYDLPAQLNIFSGLSLNENDFVTITIGGNDVGFVDILTTAFVEELFKQVSLSKLVLGSQFPEINNGTKTLDGLLSEKTTNSYKDSFITNLENAYLDIKEKEEFNNATIIVAGYPSLFFENNYDPDNPDNQLVAFTVEFEYNNYPIKIDFPAEKAHRINEAVASFNSLIEKAVNACANQGMNIYFVPVAESFKGKEAYSGNDALINGVILNNDPDNKDQTIDGNLISSYSFHPNAAGAAAYAEAVQDKIKEIETARAKSFSVLQTRINNTTNGGTLTLDQDYTALSNDGCISIAPDKIITIDLNGHTINRGLAKATPGGNVILNSGTLTIKDSGTGGKITGGNNTGNGGGINNNGTLILESGSITGNNAASGGGIYNNGTLKLQTGDKTINISGNAAGTASDNNVYLLNGKTITVDSIPAAGSIIGVTLETDATKENPVTITEDCQGDISYFVSDNTGFDVAMDGNAAKLAVPVKITFEKNDQSGTTKEQSIPGGIATKLSDVGFTLEYFSFSGWNTEALGTGKSYDKDAVVTLTADTILYAQWTKNEYLVKFVTQNGTELQSGMVEYLDTPVFIGTPTMAPDEQYTYTFDKWSPDIKAVTGEATYTAIFTEKTNEYMIKFVNDDGTELQSEKVKYGETPKYKGAKPTKTPDAQYTYTFDEWSPAITTVKGDATYIATYKETTNEYTIKFVNEDGTELQSEKVKYGETPKYNGAVPTKASDAQYTYTFDKWTPVIAEVTGSATYTATYKKTLNKYTITFVDEDGTELWASDVEYGVIPVFKGKTPSKASDAQYTYTFDKWSTDLAAVTGKATYTATYKATTNKYLISFVDEDGTVLQSSEVAYGEIPKYSGKTPAKAPDSKYTYTFDMWTPEIAKVTGAATYTAIYTSKVNEHVPGEKKIENEKKPTCTEDGSYDEVIYCETCKEEIYRKTITVAATGHDFGDWKVVKEPTITEKGMEQRVCANDPSHIETREIEKLPKMVYKSSFETVTWQKGSGKALTWTIHRAEDDKNCILHYWYTLLNGEKIPVDAKSGSTIITISAEILEKLSAGTHTITVVFDDGEVTLPLLISSATPSPDASPVTGDNSNPALWYLLTICSLAGMAMFIRYGRKHAEE